MNLPELAKRVEPLCRLMTTMQDAGWHFDGLMEVKQAIIEQVEKAIRDCKGPTGRMFLLFRDGTARCFAEPADLRDEIRMSEELLLWMDQATPGTIVNYPDQGLSVMCVLSEWIEP